MRNAITSVWCCVVTHERDEEWGRAADAVSRLMTDRCVHRQRAGSDDCVAGVAVELALDFNSLIAD